MKACGQFLLTVVTLVALFVLITRGDRVLEASVPPDMPADARFLVSGYNVDQNERQGNWVACTLDSANNTNWCRVTDAHGSVVFEGAYLPLPGSEPIPAAKLRIANVNPRRMWVLGPSERLPVPVIALEDGTLLVPASDREALIARWQEQPEEFARVTAQTR
jgi:hypothetical protein